MTDLIERLRDEIEQLRVEQAQYEEEIERLNCALTISRGKHENAIAYIAKLQAEIERLRAHIEWIGANTDSPSTALYCHAALELEDENDSL